MIESGKMKRTVLQLLIAISIITLLANFNPSIHAEVLVVGDVDPDNPSYWTYYGNAYIGNASSGELTVNNGSQIRGENSYIGYNSNSTGQVAINGTNSSWLNGYDFFVGYSGNGTLDIANGGKLDSGIYDAWSLSIIGYNSNSNGRVTVDGTDSEWYSGESFYVGYYGNGKLNITNGGEVRNGTDDNVTISPAAGYIGYKSGSMGQVKVDGTGSTWNIGNYHSAIVGDAGDGTLEVTDGGTVYSAGGIIGNDSGSSGKVLIDGDNSKWVTTNNDFYVGKEGNGTLSITNGGKADNGRAYISYESGSTGKVTVKGIGSTWLVSDISVGYQYEGDGTLEITNGGLVDSYDVNIGDGPSYTSSGYHSTGHITVDGTGTELNTLDLTVGKYSQGALDIKNNAQVDSRNGIIGSLSGATGNVTVDGAGSSWAISQKLDVGNWEATGTLNISNGGQVSGSEGYIGYGRNSSGTATINGVGSKGVIQDRICVGNGSYSYGKLNVTDGAQVISGWGEIGNDSDSLGEITIDGVGSMWASTNKHENFVVGDRGCGILNISNGGLLSVAGRLIVDNDRDGDSFINISTNGMLALQGDVDDSIAEFLSIVQGTDAIHFWDHNLSDWSLISNATVNQDYFLEYISDMDSDIYGYTKLTVIPEPATLALLGFGGLLLRRKAVNIPKCFFL